jgi:hypothetical protein
MKLIGAEKQETKTKVKTKGKKERAIKNKTEKGEKAIKNKKKMVSTCHVVWSLFHCTR